ncbi:MAG: endonuclease/exonuclease/phosphatase family protein [Prevotellaceae bacterium]|jgi:endonuclease/exonuclease/phosphatase family metal-dependent hydrolase|nr:endonuclease/exonuclease/phosphatase family protein [Prevotellaceae bacterium]
MKKIVRYLLYTLLAIIVLLLLFIEIMTLLDYKPETETILAQNRVTPLKKDTLTVLSWNTGYAGLDAGMDFFYDGGRKTRTTREQTVKNLEYICNIVQQNNSADIILLQEVDYKAHRSYNINQLDYISEAMPQYAFFFAKDYDVYFVPIPLFNPMGRVQSGMATLSRYLPSECVQHAYPAQGKWPVRLFLLDNCFISTRYPLSNGKDLLVINTHNSAFDDSEKRAVEMAYLRQTLVSEYNKGNYVIAGGDWNQIPPLPDSIINYDVSKSMQNNKYFTPLNIARDFLPSDWQWLSDGHASNRFLYEPYKKGHTAETLIDFFLASPNIQYIKKQTIDLEFAHSDHNPVILQFTFN